MGPVGGMGACSHQRALRQSEGGLLSAVTQIRSMGPLGVDPESEAGVAGMSWRVPVSPGFNTGAFVRGEV